MTRMVSQSSEEMSIECVFTTSIVAAHRIMSPWPAPRPLAVTTKFHQSFSDAKRLYSIIHMTSANPRHRLCYYRITHTSWYGMETSLGIFLQLHNSFRCAISTLCTKIYQPSFSSTCRRLRSISSSCTSSAVGSLHPSPSPLSPGNGSHPSGASPSPL